MSEAKYYSPREILDLQSRQGALNDTEKFVVDASFWARARLANYHGYSDEIPAIELNNGVFYAYTSRGKIKIPYNYDALHDKYNIEERKVLKVDTHEPDMDITQNIPQGDLEQMNGEEDITGIEQMPDGSENMPQNQFDTNFDAGVEADEETDEFVRPASDDTPISDTSATYFADKINGGLPFQNMDYSALQDVLNNQNFSQEDIIEIWSKYSEKHGNLLENLNYSLNVTAKNQATEELANIAIEQAKAGNEEAISLLAKELKASSKNMKFAPDHFMSYFFENIDTKTLSIIVQEYSQLNDGDSMAKDIGGFISFGKVHDYVKQIEDAMSLL